MNTPRIRAPVHILAVPLPIQHPVDAPSEAVGDGLHATHVGDLEFWGS